MRTLIVDQDSSLYHIAYSHSRSVEWEPGVVSIIQEDLKAAQKKVDSTLRRLKDHLSADKIILCLSCDQSNFRKGFFPNYKAHRTKPKPSLLKPLRDYCLDNYETFLRPGLEADDCVGILATHPEIIPGERIMVSPDKDMKTIPGVLVNPDKLEEVHTGTDIHADYWHLYQTLTGDTCDNYLGCPRVGPVKAEKVLKPFFNFDPKVHQTRDWLKLAWTAVVNQFELKGLTEADALTQARCARILRATDYDYTTKQPILWKAPT